MQAPLAVGIGDSIIAGHPAHNTYLEAVRTVDTAIPNQIMYQLNQINSDYVYQNMGIGGDDSSETLTRFTKDCINLKPKLALINPSVNDISGGVISKATFLSNYTTMLDACVTNNIVPVVFKMMPWTSGSNANMQKRDDWMADLQALTATYSNSVWVDFDVTIGKFRTGGDVGNLWDIQTAYNADGVHLNLAGYTAAAALINTEIRKVWK